MFICKICEYSGHNRIYSVREMMFGTRESFEYIECGYCGCIQISSIPDDISRHYPHDYYSFSEPYRFREKREKFIASQIAKYSLNGSNLIGWWYARKYPAEMYPHFHRIPAWLKGNKLRLRKKSRVLDVGSGNGALLYEMNELLDIRAVTGIDPFIESDVLYENGVKIVKARLDDINDQFDSIMLHHSLEHMPDQKGVLRHLRKLLRPKGSILIRIPICSSFAWKTYGAHWAQLDAPRHFFIHSIASFSILIEQAGFRIRDIIYDSSEFQFWASEQYKLGISLRAENSYGINPENSIFTKGQIDEFARMAEELNKRGDGDQAGFFLEAV